MRRVGKVKQRQHLFLASQRDNLPSKVHQTSGYVTAKLHGTSTCRCNNNANFSDRAILKFPAGHVNLAAAKHWQFMPKWQYGDIVDFITFRV